MRCVVASSPLVPVTRTGRGRCCVLVAKGQAADAGIDVERFRAQLEADEEFAAHFTAAKVRVADMDVRFIGVEDPIECSVFEIYEALALDTQVFNSFETH